MAASESRKGFANFPAWIIACMLLVGMTVGAGFASFFWWSVLQRERAMNEMANVAKEIVDLGNRFEVRREGKPLAGPGGDRDAKENALEQGLYWVFDLENGIVDELYDSATPALRGARTRQQFAVALQDAIGPVKSESRSTTSSVKKVGAKSWRFEFVDRNRFGEDQALTISILMEESEDEWLIGEIEVKSNKRP